MVYNTLKTKGIPFKYKDGFGAGNSSTENVVPNNVVSDKDADGKEETYIGVKDKEKLAMNKIQHTKVGDDIHYYQNGIEGRGIVVKMSNEYVMIAKEDGDFEDIHINDTFFVKDIVVNKTWDMMNSGERGEVLTKAHAPSTRFVTKSWYELPRELREVLTKSDSGGASGGNFSGEKGVSRDDETKTHRDQDQSLAANNPVTDDDQAKGLKNAGYGSEAKDQTDDEGQSLPDFKPQSAKLGQNCVSCGRPIKKKPKGNKEASDVEHGSYGGISTETPLDVSESTGYEERDHICVECAGQLPREEAKPHGANETEEGKHGDKVKEPKVVTGETSHPEDKKKDDTIDTKPSPIRNTQPNAGLAHVYNKPRKRIGTITHRDGTKTEIFDNEKHEIERFNRHRAEAKLNPNIAPFKKLSEEEDTVVNETKSSAQFRKIYGGGKKKKKGVPEWNVNTWGINYTVKEDEE